MKKLIPLFVFLLLAWSCSDDDDATAPQFDGSVNAIENFYSPETVDILEELGFMINEGNTPPLIEGSYKLDRLALEASNIDTDNVGQLFGIFDLTFENQDNANLTIDFEQINTTETFTSIDAFISGAGNNFSIYSKTDTQLGNSVVVETGVVYSGTITEAGIENIQYVIIMLDNKGNPDGVYIENNQGRLFVDNDGFSERL